jgi:hypothetical protein
VVSLTFDTSGSLDDLDHDPEARVTASEGLPHQLLQFEMRQDACAVGATGIDANPVPDPDDVIFDTKQLQLPAVPSNHPVELRHQGVGHACHRTSRTYIGSYSRGILLARNWAIDKELSTAPDRRSLTLRAPTGAISYEIA